VFIDLVVDILIKLPDKLTRYQGGISTLKASSKEIEKMKMKILEYQPLAESSFIENENIKKKLEAKKNEIQQRNEELEKATKEADTLRKQVQNQKTKYVKETQEQHYLLKKCREAVESMDKT
jgi:chromosome segregation ATPase